MKAVEDKTLTPIGYAIGEAVEPHQYRGWYLVLVEEAGQYYFLLLDGARRDALAGMTQLFIS